MATLSFACEIRRDAETGEALLSAKTAAEWKDAMERLDDMWPFRND